MAVKYLFRRFLPHTPEEIKLERAQNPDVADVVEDNICSMLELRRLDERQKTSEDRIADKITEFAGSMKFLYFHVLWFGFWMVVNVGDKPLMGFDPYPFGFLTMVVSLEAIFLSTLVMISQNKMTEVTDRRADLDLQINLLAEHEITRILQLVDAIADKLEIEEAKDKTLDELKTVTAPAKVLQEIQERTAQAKKL